MHVEQSAVALILPIEHADERRRIHRWLRRRIAAHVRGRRAHLHRIIHGIARRSIDTIPEHAREARIAGLAGRTRATHEPGLARIAVAVPVSVAIPVPVPVAIPISVTVPVPRIPVSVTVAALRSSVDSLAAALPFADIKRIRHAHARQRQHNKAKQRKSRHFVTNLSPAGFFISTRYCLSASITMRPAFCHFSSLDERRYTLCPPSGRLMRARGSSVSILPPTRT